MRAGRRGSELPARSASVDQHDEHDGVEAGVGQDGYPGGTCSGVGPSKRDFGQCQRNECGGAEVERCEHEAAEQYGEG